MSNFLAGIFSRKTNPTPPASQLRVQTSVQSTPIPIGWGQNRLAPNLIYYNDFKVVAVANSSAGGKGSGTGGGGKFGGGGTQNNYFATIICGLCEGPVNAIGVAWSAGNITTPGALNFAQFNGNYSQTAWSYITTTHPADARNYRGIAYVAAAPFDLKSNPELPSINFEVQFGFLEPSGTTLDANPRDIIVDFLTNNKYGLLFPSSRIGDTNLVTLYNYCQAVGIWMSPVLATHKDANSFMGDILYGCVAEAVWSGGQLRVVPYYDAAASGHGATYTPNLSPIYDLTDNDFHPGNNNNYQTPVVVMLKAVADIYNNVKIQYLDRNFNYAGAVGTTPDYNPTVVEAKDDASIQQFTLRARDTKQLDLFCYGPAAQTCAQLQLGREQVLTTYQFSLGAKFVLLEPMDLVTLTDANLGLSRKLVRIKEITENEDYTLTFVAEDMLVGAASPPLYGQQANTGFVVNTNADPGLTLAPFFFEPTDQLAGGLEVWMAVVGANLTTWAGANVYVSTDGTNYQFAGQQLGPTRMGVTTASFASTPLNTTPPTIDNAHVLSVDMTKSQAQLTSASTADVLAFATLSYLNGEFIAYTNANSTGTNLFSLTGINRAGYGTTPQSSAAGTTFVRCDAGVFRIPYTQDRIGQTLFVKLVNFNHYGAGPQTLASVSPYTYTIVGTALTSPLPDVQNFTTNYQSNITLFSWDEVKDFRNPIDYEIRRGVDWPSGQFIGRYLHPNVPAIGSSTGGTQYLIKAHCQPVAGLDVYSADASAITIVGNVIPLNIVKTFDEFAVPVLSGTFGGSAYNDANTIETSGLGDLYAVPEVYSLLDFYNFGFGFPANDVYSITDVYQVGDIYDTNSSNTSSGTYTAPSSHWVNVGRSTGCLIDCSWQASGVPVGQNIFSWTSIFTITDVFSVSANSFIAAFPNINVSSDGVFNGDIYQVTNVYALQDVFMASTTSTGWQRYRAGFYVGRGFAMQMNLISNDPNTICAVSAFSYAVHIPSRIDHYIGMAVGIAGSTITFTPDGAGTAAAFNGGPGGGPAVPGLPTWQATITNEVSGDLLTVSSLTLSSAVVAITNGGSGVARTVNIEFAGY